MSTLSPNLSAVPSLRVSCSHCNLREHCVPLGLSLRDIDRLEDLIASRKRIHRGEPLFRAGDRFEAIYAIRLGFLKSSVMSSDGREQVTNFHMSGELIGLDGIANEVPLKTLKCASFLTNEFSLPAVKSKATTCTFKRCFPVKSFVNMVLCFY